MNLTILGTGNAVTHCYNTCFVLEEKGQHLLVDGGGEWALTATGKGPSSLAGHADGLCHAQSTSITSWASSGSCA